MKKEKPASKKQVSKALMPEVGTIIDGKYKVIYINYMQFRITCKGKNFPEMGEVLDIDSKLFKVGEDRFSADFIGFKEHEIPEAPETKNEVVSLLE